VPFLAEGRRGETPSHGKTAEAKPVPRVVEKGWGKGWEQEKINSPERLKKAGLARA